MASTDGPLDAVNEAFHNAYDEARHAAKREGPVFIVLADELVVFHRGERRVLSFSPRAFHVLKSVAHAPVALYAAFEKAEPPSSDDLTGMRARIASAYEKLPENTGDLSESASEDVAFVLRSSLEVIDRVLRDGPVRAHLASFAARVGEALLRLAQEATRIQLKALHEHTEEAMSALSQEERAELQVVVTGNHQARERALAMQYFQKRFAESSGPEDQVSYAEGASDEREALELVGTQRLDRALARAFFGDEKRLQRDILGDAAEQQLGTLSFP